MGFFPVSPSPPAPPPPFRPEPSPPRGPFPVPVEGGAIAVLLAFHSTRDFAVNFFDRISIALCCSLTPKNCSPERHAIVSNCLLYCSLFSSKKRIQVKLPEIQIVENPVLLPIFSLPNTDILMKVGVGNTLNNIVIVEYYSALD